MNRGTLVLIILVAAGIVLFVIPTMLDAWRRDRSTK